MDTPRAELLGLPVDLIGRPAAVRHLAGAEHPLQVVTLNAEMAMLAQSDPDLAAVIRGAGLVIPDGAGVVWALRRQGHQVGRLPGIDLVMALFEAHPGLRYFFLGADDEVCREAAARAGTRVPGLQVVGMHHGYFSPAEEPDVLQRIRAAGPDVLLVALGVPRQEKWIAHHLPDLGVRVCIGVGGTLDVLAGRVRRAPTMLRRAQLEWLYRLYREPWRWRRMQALPRFVRAVRASEKVRS